MTMKNAVFWDVAPCRYFVNWRFGGTYRLHLQGIINPRAMNQREQVPVDVPPKRLLTKYLHDTTSQKTAFFNSKINKKVPYIFERGPWMRNQTTGIPLNGQKTPTRKNRHYIHTIPTFDRNARVIQDCMALRPARSTVRTLLYNLYLWSCKRMKYAFGSTRLY
jgi:hypothetical protein